MQHLPLIVLVEPEWPTRSYVRAELEELGYDVSVHARAADAIAYLERWGLRPHVIVVDLAQDGQQGEALRTLLEQYPEAALILLVSPLRAVPRWLEQRAAIVLKRPVTIRDIIATVQRLAPLPGNPNREA